jgi:Fur family ferric uptake transcriptional regulator
MVCLKCGKVVEFMDDVIESRQKQIAADNGFIITEHSMILYGHCNNPNCRGA